MAFVDDVNRILRDFEGYTGDGQGGSGSLPVGDRSTSRHPLSKRDLRELLIQMAQTLGDPSALQDILDELEGKADAADLADVATSGDKADIGLGNVDNTSDADKPVSTAQQTALTAVEKSAFERASSEGYLFKDDRVDRPLILGDGGEVLSAVDGQGFPILPLSSGLYHGDGEGAAFEMRDRDGKRLFGTDAHGNPVFETTTTLYRENENTIWDAGICDESGRPILRFRDGRLIDGGDRLDALPVGVNGTQGPSYLWSAGGVVRQAWPLEHFYTAPGAEIFETAQDVYDIYDQLVDDFPDYVTRTSLGVDGQGTPIYQYEFYQNTVTSYESIWSHADYAPPKIVMCSGVHGGERLAITGTLIFAINLCRNWRTREGYERLRWGARIVIIPCAVPSGVTLRQRQNWRGVDVNRNFDADWSAELVNPGDAPGDQEETQILMTLPSLHPDACGWLDNHNHGQPQFFWLASLRRRTLSMLLDVGHDLVAMMRREVRPLEADPEKMIFITDNKPATFSRWLQNVAGVDFVLLETHSSVAHAQMDGTQHTRRLLHERGIVGIVTQYLNRERRRLAEAED